MEGDAWEIALDRPRDYFGLNENMVLRFDTDQLSIGLRSRLANPITTSIFVHTATEWITNGALCVKLSELVLRYRPAIYTWA